ncbi:DUF4349 domain-containing protein [Sphingomonas sp. CJ20]
MRKLLIVTLSATLAACSAQESGQSGDAPTAPAAEQKPRSPAKLDVKLPQLAYSYALHFMLPGAKMQAAQDAHLAFCDWMGPTRCQLLAMERGSADDASSLGSIKLRVATADAKLFSDTLSQQVTGAGGRTVDTKIGADDVSKQIVDAEARIHQRELLVSRLTEVLRTRTGKVGDLVDAERSVAQAQEELDQARGWLTELRGRVAMSTFELRYEAIAPALSASTMGSQLGEAAQGAGSAFLIGLRLLLTLLLYVGPWAALLLLALWLGRKWGKRNDAPSA